jgi:hypothetical protein
MRGDQFALAGLTFHEWGSCREASALTLVGQGAHLAATVYRRLTGLTAKILFEAQRDGVVAVPGLLLRNGFDQWHRPRWSEMGTAVS